MCEYSYLPDKLIVYGLRQSLLWSRRRFGNQMTDEALAALICSPVHFIAGLPFLQGPCALSTGMAPESGLKAELGIASASSTHSNWQSADTSPNDSQQKQFLFVL